MDDKKGMAWTRWHLGKINIVFNCAKKIDRSRNKKIHQ